MYCNNCGKLNDNNQNYCTQCGSPLASNQNIEKNNSTKNYSIFSIIVGSIGIICGLIVGMSLLLSIVISNFGFTLAKKGYDENKKLSIVGYVLNGILLILGIAIYVCVLIGIV